MALLACWRAMLHVGLEAGYSAETADAIEAQMRTGRPLASADWMQRNFDRRVEIAFPVVEEQHQAMLKKILEIQLGDNVKGWRIEPDGSSVRRRSEGSLSARSQEQLYEFIRNEPVGAATRAAIGSDMRT